MPHMDASLGAPPLTLLERVGPLPTAILVLVVRALSVLSIHNTNKLLLPALRQRRIVVIVLTATAAICIVVTLVLVILGEWARLDLNRHRWLERLLVGHLEGG